MGMQQVAQPNYYQMAPKYEIIQVKGEAGANNFRMAPNSRAILADETAPMIWFAHTDSGGYLTVEPYDIYPHKAQEPVNLNDLAERVKKLEDLYVQQSTSKSKKQRQPAATVEPANGSTEANGTNV